MKTPDLRVILRVGDIGLFRGAPERDGLVAGGEILVLAFERPVEMSDRDAGQDVLETRTALAHRDDASRRHRHAGFGRPAVDRDVARSAQLPRVPAGPVPGEGP